MDLAPTRQPSAVLPVVMSLGALAAVLYQVAVHGTAPQADEGAAAHVWQLLMAGQLPVVAYYAITSLRRAPRAALPVVAVQVAAALAALAPVYWLGW